MKSILIIPNKLKDKSLDVSRRVAELLTTLGATVYIDGKYIEYIGGGVNSFCECAEIELIIVIGGDGSILDAAKYAIERKIPLLGVNLGKVGYLSEVDVDNIEVLRKLFTGEFYVEDKMLLETDCISDGTLRHSERLALNDIIIGHDTFLGIAEFKLEKSGGETVKYRADGIIFSTPVGSTAYSLSAGGPIVAHDIDSILVTPIAPHSFFNRSIIFNSNERLAIKNCGSTELNVSVDGRLFGTLNEGDECVITKSDKTLKILTFNQNNTFTTLFKKVRILEDVK